MAGFVGYLYLGDGPKAVIFLRRPEILLFPNGTSAHRVLPTGIGPEGRDDEQKPGSYFGAVKNKIEP